MKTSAFARSTQIAALIHADGTVDYMVVTFAPDSDVAMAALMAVREWHYSPTYLDGHAVEVVTTIDVKFHPRD